MTALTGRTPMPRESGGHSAMTVRRRSASVSTATAIAWKIRCSLRRSGMPRRQPAPVSFILTVSAKPEPERCGCRTPGRSFPNLKLTLGGRLETWQALNGYNINTATSSAAGSSPRRRRSTSRTSARPTSRPKRRYHTIPTRTGTLPRISVRPIAIPPSTELYQNITVSGVDVRQSKSGAGAGF